MKYIFLAVVIVAVSGSPAAAGPSAAVLEAESQRIAVMETAKNCVLAIFPANGQGGGSGVVISADGYALTNFHVVQPCGKAMQCGMADGKVYDAVLVAIDPTGDVALIKLFGREDFAFAEMADSDRLRVGDWAFAMGNPFLLATDFQPTTTYGLISGVHRYQFPSGTLLEYTDCLQVDVSINPGNSGGPLFDARGRLIGINGRASFEKRGRVNVGAAYAISINQVKNFLGVLHSGRIVDHATLGARVSADADGRVVVSEISENSDAYRRGLRYDDEIVSFGGRPITTPNAFKNVLGIFPQGWRVPLTYRRDGQRHDVLVRLAGVHGQEELLQKMAGNRTPEMMPPKPGDAPPRKQGDGEKPGGKPPKLPLPGPHGPRQPIPIPEVVTKHFEEKRGYANYFFNAQHQQRIWKAWNARTSLAGTKAAWLLSGQTATGSEFRFTLADDGGSLKLPATEVKWAATDELQSSLLPEHSGGLLPALYLWRRLATEGIARFGHVYYYGTAPLAGRPGLVDVLVGSYKGVEGRFYFDPEGGRLLAMEMFSDDDSDPCELYFSDYHERDGRFVPGQIAVRCGNDPYATFTIKDFMLAK